MKPGQLSQGFVIGFAAIALAGMMAGCDDNVALGTPGRDGSLGTGGAAGTGGAGSGGSHADAALGSGGTAGGTGGRLLGDAAVGSGGSKGQTGGIAGSGGVIGTGGATGVGGSDACGTIAGIMCQAGLFCDLRSNCGAIPDAPGTCVLTGPGIACTADYVPVCGCDGKTYSNDCNRRVAGVLKASDGACTGGTGGIITDGGAPGSGGTIGSGGAAGSGAVTGTGGMPGTGGIITDGGAPGSGGTSGGGAVMGSGGMTGTGGSANTCGGPVGTSCSAGLFCDLASDCGQIANATGVCRLTGPNLACTADVNPVCGCDGKTYSNDCERAVAGMLKAADGVCAGGDGGLATYPTAYLAWRAPGGAAGTGPAVVVSGAGWADTWTSVSGFSPETPPSNATGTYTLTSTQTDDLFARVAAVNTSSLPHASTWAECYPTLYFRFCAGCTATTLDYNLAAQVSPEMDPVWLWFDQVLGATDSTNPRNYCAF